MKRYKAFFRAGILGTFSYKATIYLWIIITALQVLATIFLWNAVYSSSPDTVINGFSFREMIVYLSFTNVFSFVAINCESIWQIDNDMYNGTVAVNLIKPINYRRKFMFYSLGNATCATLIVGIPLYTILLIIFKLIGFISYNSVFEFLLYLLMFVVSIFLTAILNDSITFMFGTVVFYTNTGWGVSQIKDTLTSFLSGTLLPLSFFPGVFGFIVKWLPFAGLISGPVLILMGKVTLLGALHNIGFVICWILVIEITNYFLFKIAARHITVQGG